MDHQNNVTYMGELNFHDYYQILYRGRWIILFCFLVVVAGMAAWTFSSNFVYQSTATVSIDTRNTLSRMKNIGTAQDYNLLDPDRIIKNEVEFLKSRSLSYALTIELTKMNYVDSISKTPLLIIHKEHDGKGDVLSPDVVAARIQSDITITPSSDADYIEIAASSSSPEEAALLANKFIDTYFNNSIMTSRLRMHNVREFLGEQVKSKKQELNEAESALKNLMERERIVSLDDEAKKTIEILSKFQASRDEAMIENETINKTLTSLQDQLEKEAPQTARDIAVANDKYIENLQNEIAKLEVNRDVIIAQNSQNTNQQTYKSQLQEIEKQIKALHTRLNEKTDEIMKLSIPDQPPTGQGGAFSYIWSLKEKIIDNQIKKQSLDSKIKILNEIIRQYEGQFNRMPARSLAYARLERDRSTAEKVYIMVSEKFQEAFIAEQSEFGYINILDRAQPVYTPVKPKVFLNLLISIVAGLILGIGVVFLRGALDGRIRGPEDIKKHNLVPLALIHNFKTVDEAKKDLFTGAGGDDETPLSVAGRIFDRSLVVYHNPMSPVAESFRRLRTSLFFVSPEKQLKSILVASAEPSEGKTTVAVNLAISLAQLGKKTLLVDADLRRGILHTLVDTHRSPGLTELLLGEEKNDGAIQKTSIEDLFIVSSGMHANNPAELLSTAPMHQFRKYAEKNFDIVIYDSSSLLLVTDALVLSTLVDGVILVVQSGETRTAVLEKSVEMMKQVGTTILGVVINRFDYRSTLHSFYKSNTYGSYKNPGEKEAKTVRKHKRISNNRA